MMDRPETIPADGVDEAALRAIEEFVARLQAAQQAEDVAGFVAFFAEDSVWTTAHGKRIVGRDAIHAFTEVVLPGAMRKATARYDIERIAFLRKDVVVVSVRQRPRHTRRRSARRVREGRPTYVLTREHGDWLIAAGQNTQVKEP
jgi:uncharacterized protein (TIGR02246 family)